jgi:hypothetical protein
VRDPAVAIALLRIVVGLYFARALVTKLTVALVGGFVPLPQASARWVAAMPHIVAKQASANSALLPAFSRPRHAAARHAVRSSDRLG